VTDHLLHLDDYTNGVPIWRLECCHPPDMYEHKNADGTGVLNPVYTCRIMHGWEILGTDILDIAGPILVLPIPVRHNNKSGLHLTLLRDGGV